MMIFDDDGWQERGRIAALNEFYAIAEHLLAAGGTLADFKLSLDTDMSLGQVRSTWPIRAAARPAASAPPAVTVSSIEAELMKAVEARFKAQSEVASPRGGSSHEIAR